MRLIIHLILAANILYFCSSCSLNSSKTHSVTIVTYDSISDAEQNCPLIRLFFTTGFDNNQLTVIWNNTIIYNGNITTDDINGVALRTITIPKNPGNMIVTVDKVSLEKEIEIDYCNMIYRKSGDSLFLEFTNRKPAFD